MRFKEYIYREMAARRSYGRTISKYEEDVTKPVATLTAWRRHLDEPHSEQERRRINDAANEKLARNLAKRGLSFYPVVGAGQETGNGVTTTNKENSFIVQPIGDMDNETFIKHLQELLRNPVGEPGGEKHAQWGAVVKLPGSDQSYLLHSSGDVGASPEDYNITDPIGDTATPRKATDTNYTQMKYGPRAAPSMVDPSDEPTDVGNFRLGIPGGGQPGRRFTIK